MPGSPKPGISWPRPLPQEPGLFFCTLPSRIRKRKQLVHQIWLQLCHIDKITFEIREGVSLISPCVVVFLEIHPFQDGN